MKKATTITPDFIYKKGQVSADDRVKELERRDVLIRDEPAATATVAPSSSLLQERSFEDPNQKWIVVNFAGRNQRPKKDRPALRILGAFDSEEETRHYIATATPLLRCNMWMLPTQRWMLICKTMDRQQDAKYTQAKIETLKSLYLQDKTKRNSEFAANRENQQQGSVNQSLHKQKQLAQEKHGKNKTSSRIKALREKAQEMKSKKVTEVREEVPSVNTCYQHH